MTSLAISADHQTTETKGFRDLADTPLKKAALIVFILCNFGPLWAPLAGMIASFVGMSTSASATVSGLTLAVSELLLLASMLVLGKELVALCKLKGRALLTRLKPAAL